MAAATLVPTPTQVATPPATPIPPPTPSPTATATAAPVPPPTPEPDPYGLILQLTNQVRTDAGLAELVIGDNQAAQIHAELSLANCISSHWSTDGLIGVMRYSLAGGYQSNQEAVSGHDFCKSGALGYRTIDSLAQEVRNAFDGWLNSPGHREAILNPRHRKVNIGLAWDDYNFRAVQQFEGDYVEFTQLPNIRDGILSMQGSTKNGADLEHGDHYRVHIRYFPPPSELTRGQIARSFGTCPARWVAFLSYVSDGVVEGTWEKCFTPYDVRPELPGPSSSLESRRTWEKARDTYYNVREEVPIVIPRIKMSEFQVDSGSFAIEADLSAVLQEHGHGVYEVSLWGIVDSKAGLISEYTIFYGITAPDTYGPQ